MQATIEKIIYNKDMDFDLTRCKHGIETHSCYLCSGQADIDYLKRKELKERVTIKDKELQSIMTAYETIKDSFKEDRELWTLDEIELVWEELGGRRGKDLKKNIFVLATVIDRSYGDINWQYLHLFVAKPYHRSQLIIDFLAIKGIVHPERTDRKKEVV